MYNGWLTYAGTEIANSQRVVAYASLLQPMLDLNDCYECDLGSALGDGTYAGPATDDAPWYDPDDAVTAEFLGFYPLTMSGFTDSTREAEAQETTLDGGFITRPRAKTREMRVTGLLIGNTVAGAEAGMSWLKSAVKGTQCGGTEGEDMCFLVACPDVSGLSTQTLRDAETDKHLRHLRNVVCTDGPTVIRAHDLSTGGHMIQVEMRFVAGTPYVYGEPTEIASASGTTLTLRDPNAAIFSTATLPMCSYTPDLLPILDPDCAVVPAPPQVPSFTSACGAEPASYFSYAIKIPATALHIWKDAVPILQIRTGSEPVRHMRIRLLPIVPENTQPENLDPCSACSEFVINYIPGSTSAVVDGMTERVTMQVSNRPAQGADHLLSGVGTEVFEWPLLTCGVAYYMLVDVDVSTIVELDLYVANRE